jgi:hypothetical protein
MVEFIFVKLDLWNHQENFIAVNFDDPSLIRKHSNVFIWNPVAIKMFENVRDETKDVIKKELGEFKILSSYGHLVNRFIKNPTYRLLELNNKQSQINPHLIKLAKEQSFSHRSITIKEKVEILVTRRK